jgi:transposase
VSLEPYFWPFATAELAPLQAICMDMQDPYIRAVHACVPEPEDQIVFDKFHVMRLMNEAVDQVRRQEHKQLRDEGVDTLTGTRYLWLYPPDNLPQHLLATFRQLRQMDLQVSRAWAIKETLRQRWHYRREGWGRRFFKERYFWATHSRLDPVIAAARTIHGHLDNILTYLHHRLTNALNESINGQIEKVKRMASGFRNRDHFHTAIYFHCGGLDLYPRRSPTAGGGHPL